MSRLADFMKNLGQDSQLMTDYKQDPRGVMRANGLSDEEIDAVMTGDEAQLKSLSGDDDYQAYVIIHHGND